VKKQFTWIVLIALGVFLGIFAYERYAAFRLELEAQELLEAMQAEQQAANLKFEELERQREVGREAERQLEFDQTTACGMSEDKGTCSCLSTKTGAMVSLSHQECLQRARAGIH